MGGSSSGGGYRFIDSKTLEEKARQILQNGQGKRNIFISFAYEDIDEVNLLRGQAANERSDIEFNDYSVREAYNSERAEYIKSRLMERINRTSMTVVYISEATKNSEWVKWEVSKSLELGKKVIAVHKGEVAPSLPSWIGEHGIKVVKWSNLSDEL